MVDRFNAFARAHLAHALAIKQPTQRVSDRRRWPLHAKMDNLFDMFIRFARTSATGPGPSTTAATMTNTTERSVPHALRSTARGDLRECARPSRVFLLRREKSRTWSIVRNFTLPPAKDDAWPSLHDQG